MNRWSLSLWPQLWAEFLSLGDTLIKHAVIWPHRLATPIPALHIAVVNWIPPITWGPTAIQTLRPWGCLSHCSSGASSCAAALGLQEAPELQCEAQSQSQSPCCLAFWGPCCSVLCHPKWSLPSSCFCYWPSIPSLTLYEPAADHTRPSHPPQVP